MAISASDLFKTDIEPSRGSFAVSVTECKHPAG